ncbi:MAG: FliA/WhiG family RNA polymerase sigma factor [Gemmatimonadetes bacterium]|nr:FliA/WhiG family RNA polymerase sigma factor [Gemmatimonadota bacterium]MBI3568669.1 FliA/WhiG family RNA polymerase sigma factor [Gemmatimonadota bacterium]
MDLDPIWTRYRKGDADARQQLLNEHLGLVYFVARQLASGLGADVEFDEFVSAGTLGLMSALESFDPSRGLAFSTFAAPRIRGSILDELRRQDHVPRSIRRKARQISAAHDAASRADSRDAGDKETAARLGVDVETLWKWQADIEGAVHIPLDRKTRENNEESPTPAETLASHEDDIEDRVNFDQEVSILRDAIQGLGEQERIVLTLYYFEELKLHEIASILQLTESRVSQIRSKALGKLRKQLSPLRANVA